MKITVVGSGYVGLVTGACLAEVGHTVTCVDTNDEKIRMLKNGQSPIYEPGLDQLLERNIKEERITFTKDLREALPGSDVAFIAVGTPEGEDGSADLKYVMAVAESIGELVNDRLVTVVKSTVPVGTCDKVEAALSKKLQERGSQVKVTVASNPEFLKEGVAIDDFMKPDRIVCGVSDAQDGETFKKLYKPFIMDDPGRLLVLDRRSSEMTKYASNAMLATRISFMNELSLLCENAGANIDYVRQGMGSDSRIGKKFLYAGPGYGGSCFPKDVSALLKTGEEYGASMRVLDAVLEANRAQKERCAEKITKHLGAVQGKKVALWGLSFKPGTDDVRETPALTIAEKLSKSGAHVFAHDPKAVGTFKKLADESLNIQYVEHAFDALSDADALVLVTEWSEYRRPDWTKVKNAMRGNHVFDLRNQYDYQQVKEAGFNYYCVGRPDETYS